MEKNRGKDVNVLVVAMGRRTKARQVIIKDVSNEGMIKVFQANQFFMVCGCLCSKHFI